MSFSFMAPSPKENANSSSALCFLCSGSSLDIHSFTIWLFSTHPLYWSISLMVPLHFFSQPCLHTLTVQKRHLSLSLHFQIILELLNHSTIYMHHSCFLTKALIHIFSTLPILCWHSTCTLWFSLFHCSYRDCCVIFHTCVWSIC